MLAGCPLSSRHQLRSEAALAMSTAQRFDLPCGFSKRGGRGRGDGTDPRVGDGRGAGTCASFRSHPAPAVSQAVSWGTKVEPAELGGGNGGLWERRGGTKRSHDEDAMEEYSRVVRAKRTRIGDGNQLVCGGGGDEVWFHQSIAGTPQAAAEEEEEEKVFLVPSAASFPHGMAGPSVAAAKKEELSKSPSDSGSSSGTDGGSAAWPEVENGSQGTAAAAPEEAERQGLELVMSLTACADAIAARNHDAANYYLARLGEVASPSSTPIHRVAAYFAEAFALRAVKLWPHVFDISPPRALTDHNDNDDDDDATALRILNNVSPIPRFLHFTLNERLLRAFEGQDRVHVIDFDIKQGLQWPSLLQSLALRPRRPAHVRITGVGESRQELHATGAMLARVADALGLAFEFHAVVDRLEDVRLWMLHVKRDERVAVNCVLVLHRLLRDESGGALADFLGLVRSTNPAVLLLGEHEAEQNAGPWEARCARALQYYAAVFDAMDATGLPEASAARAKAEEMFAREIRNSVAFEGVERYERHESFAAWQRLMEDGGFKNAGIGDREALQSRMIARMFAPGRYTIQSHDSGDERGSGGGGLTLKWLDQALYTVSAWTPASEAAGDSTLSASTTASKPS